MATNPEVPKTQDSSKIIEAAEQHEARTQASNEPGKSAVDITKVTETVVKTIEDKKPLIEAASDAATDLKENVTGAVKTAVDKSSAIIDSVSTTVMDAASSILHNPKSVKEDGTATTTTEKPVDLSAPTDTKVESATSTSKPVDLDAPTDKKVESAAPTNKPVDLDAPTDKKVEAAAPTIKPVDLDAPTDTKVESVAPTSKPVDLDAPTDTKVESATSTSKPVDLDAPTDKKVESAAPTNKPVDLDAPTDKKVEAATSASKPVDLDAPTDKKVEAAAPTTKPVDLDAPTDKKVESATSATKPVDLDAPTDKKVEAAAATGKPVDLDAPTDKKVEAAAPTNEKVEPVVNTDKPVELAVTKDKPVDIAASTGKNAESAAAEANTVKPTVVNDQRSNQSAGEKETKVAELKAEGQEKFDGKKVDSTVNVSTSSTQNGDKAHQGPGSFPIKKGNAKNLTDFQRKKAEYFFNVNLDHDNKKSLAWNDVEDYFLFHVTTANKAGPASSELEAKLSRAGRSLWEHIFDQIPSADGKRDQLALEQFLDTWASLIDYIVEHGQLPSLVQDLVDLGFELYSNQDSNASSRSVPVNVFEQLFEKMNLGRSFALMAHKFLTDNGTKPLDKDKVNSTVRAVITSSDDGHPSHFLLPGFFKTLANKSEKTDDKTKPSPTPSPVPQPTADSTSPTPQKEETKKDEIQPAKPTVPSPSGDKDLSEGSLSRTSTGGDTKLPSTNSQSHPTTQTSRLTIQQLDNQIRQLLLFYHIDDTDVVEVSDGPGKRIVLVHPERPVPAHLQQGNKGIQQLKDPVVAQTASVTASDTTTSTKSQPKVTLEERVARGEAQVGPTVPVRQEQESNQNRTTGIKQVFPAPGTEDAKNASEQSNKSEKEEAVKTPSPAQETPTITPEDEKKIVEDILKKITPLVEELVANAIRRIRRGGKDDDGDDDGFVPFPFMFGGPGLGGGMSGGPAFIPPELLMNMMNDLSRGNVGEGFPNNRPPPPQNSRAGPVGVEGFMMFSNGNPTNIGSVPFQPPY